MVLRLAHRAARTVILRINLCIVRLSIPLTSPSSFSFKQLPLLAKVRTGSKMIRYSYLMARLYALFRYGHLAERTRWEVRPADPKGEGLFATISISKGSLLFVATGPVEFGHFEGQDCYTFPDWYMVNHDIWIDIQKPYIKINHSCEPNVGIDGSRCFVAIRDIAPEEELTFDYSITDDESDWEMTCLCGSTHCRKTVRAIQNTPEEDLLRSYPYIPTYFKNLYTHL